MSKSNREWWAAGRGTESRGGACQEAAERADVALGPARAVCGFAPHNREGAGGKRAGAEMQTRYRQNADTGWCAGLSENSWSEETRG